MGVEKGKSWTWFIKPFQPDSDQDSQSSFSPWVYFQIKDNNPKELCRLHVDELAKSIPQYKHRSGRSTLTKTLSREIARIIHEECQLSAYVKSPPGDGEIFKAASNFVQIAITIGSLHTLTHHADSSSNAFALNLSAITVHGTDPSQSVQTGEFAGLLQNAMDYGMNHTMILWAAALLWGGVSLASQGNTPVNDHVLGIVAPQCTIILDFIRDPLSLARYGLGVPLLSIYRGAAPLLGRDPRSGYVIAQTSQKYRPSAKIDCHDAVPGRKRTTRPSLGDLLITFEAGFGGAVTDNLFLAWYKGDLAFELNPECVFQNLLVRRCIPAEESRMPLQAETLPYCLDFMELMQKQIIYIDHSPAVLLAGPDPAWVVVAAGCIHEIGATVISLGGLDLKLATKNDLFVYCEF